MAMLAAAAVGIQVGLATVASRYVLGQTDALTLALLRYSFALVCLLPLLDLRGLTFRAHDFAIMALLGIIQFGLLIALFNFALLTLPAGRVAVIFSIFPMLTLALSSALGRETFSATKFAGASLTVLGVGLALGGGAAGGFQFTMGAAEWAVVGAAMCGAFASVFYRHYVERYGPVTVGGLAMAASVLALALLMAVLGRAPDIARLSGGGGAAILFVGLSSGLGYLALLWAFKKATPTRVTIFQPLAPITAAIVGAVALGEPITPLFALGIATVGAGIILAHR